MIGNTDLPTFAVRMKSTFLQLRALGSGWSRSALFLIALVCSVGQLLAQGSENFTNAPNTGAFYTAISWNGTDGVPWFAEGVRTDQNLNGKALCFGTTAHGSRKVVSPSYAGGMGTLSFNYVRGFAGTGGRSLEVWVNGVQVGATIVVSPTSDVVVAHSQQINIGGDIVLEIRSTGASQVKLDDIVWTPYVAGPAVSFITPAASALEDAGSVPVEIQITPASAGGTITIGVTNGPGVFYGAAGDYTTTPAVVGGTITLTVPAGATTASFLINIVDDLAAEADETITFTITGVTGGMSLGALLTHTFTIIDNDNTPTVNFSTLSIAVLENAGVQTFQMSIMPPAAAAGSVTINVVDGPGATYGLGNDYLTNPPVIGGTITVNFVAGATAASFTVTVFQDGIAEDTETVTFTLAGASAGAVIGGNSSATLTIGDMDSPPTVLEPGDLVIVGVNANTGGCAGGVNTQDEISFFCFKPITWNTTIDLTDCGYSHTTAGMWGNTEGVLRARRTGIAIPAGQVITFRLYQATNNQAVAPDAQWQITSLNGPNNHLNLNSSGGDQIFFMQGGNWLNAGVNNSTYTGDVLYGYSTNGQWLPLQQSASHSGLPGQLECFSMAPVSIADFNKYVGPITAATQRNWIIRLDDPANWTTYANCTQYSTQGYNWLNAPILPIIAGSFQAGKWTGAKDTDWFECKNWDDARVPTIVTDVSIDETAIRNCSVGLAAGLSPAGTGECASVTVTNNGISRSLTLEANSTLNVNGPMLVERTGGTGVLNVNVQAGATLNATEILLQSVSTEARLNCNAATSLASFETNVTIGMGGMVALGVGGGTVQLGGNWTNFAGELSFQETTGRIIFNGGNDQYIMTSGTGEVFNHLRVAKTGGDLILASPIAVRGILDMQNGLLNSTATELLTMRAGSSAINYTDASFVNGPVEKVGLTAFTFPVGKGNELRPCGLRNYAGGAATDAFIAEYFPASPITTFNNVLEPTLDHISDCEYWMIDRSSGTANAIVELTWDTPSSCGVTSLPDLRVARWNGTMWLDRGNGGAVGDNNSGTIPTAVAQNLFSPWTLASVNSLNPLPITLVSFTAKAEGDVVRLDWITATEVNNDHFTVERSRNGYDFEEILEVPGAGTSYTMLSYTELDRSPMNGINYYRLRQTDHDGTCTYSPLASVMFSGGSQPLVVFGNADVINAMHAFGPESRYEVLDMTGRIILQGSSRQDGRTEVAAGSIPRGAYIFRMSEGDRIESVRFIY